MEKAQLLFLKQKLINEGEGSVFIHSFIHSCIHSTDTF